MVPPPEEGMAAVADPPQAPNKTKQTKSSYRPEIDGLRAFAVIAVIINHFNKDLLPSGYLGVDIFFVISGYVITSSLSGRESKNFGDFLSGFYERRIKRLVPALVVFILVTSILICLFNPDPELALKTGMTSLFGLSNLYLFKQSTDYFAQSTELNPFTHTWSLGVEEQFYLIFPFLIWFSGFGRQAKNGARNLFFWVGALTVASLASFICLYQSNQAAAYFLMPPRFWEMAAGCLVFIGFQKRAKIEQTLEKVPPLLVVTAIVALMFLPISWAVQATISLVILSAVLLACLKSGTTAFIIFTHQRVVYVGLISYSLYLWHWGVLSVSRWSIGINWWSVPIQICLIWVLSCASYIYIEDKARHALWQGRALGAIATGLASQITASIGILVIQKTIGTPASEYKIEQDQGMISGTTVNRRNCHKKPLTYGLEETKRCHVPAKGTNINLVVVGDSHANAFIPAYTNPNLRSSFNLITSTRPGGKFGYGWSGDPKEKEGITRLNIDRNKYIINRARRGDVVLVVNHFLGELDTMHPRPGRNVLSKSERDRYIRNLLLELDSAGLKLKRLGATLIVSAPLPNFHHKAYAFNLKNCINAKFWQRIRSCEPSYVDRREMIQRAHEVKDALLDKSKRGNFLVFDGFSVICPANQIKCSTHISRESAKSVAVYRDMDHISTDGAIVLSNQFADFLKSYGLIPRNI